MLLKSCGGLFLGLIITGMSMGQTDSTDLNFTAVEFEHESSQDTMTYGAGELSELKLEFTIDDLANFGKLWVEIVQCDPNDKEVAVYYGEFTLAALQTSGFIDENEVKMELAVLVPGLSYKLVLRMEDTYGHERISISKYL